MTLSKPSIGPDLLKRDGLYYARLHLSFSNGLVEIALHGVASEDQARAAVNALVKPRNHRRPGERSPVEATMLKCTPPVSVGRCTGETSLK